MEADHNAGAARTTTAFATAIRRFRPRTLTNPYNATTETMYMTAVATSIACVMLAPLAATPAETNSE